MITTSRSTAASEVIVAGTSVFGKPGVQTDLNESVKALRDAADYALYIQAHPPEPPPEN